MCSAGDIQRGLIADKVDLSSAGLSLNQLWHLKPYSAGPQQTHLPDESSQLDISISSYKQKNPPTPFEFLLAAL